MKKLQLIEQQAALVIDSPKVGEALDVSEYGPLSLAIQLVATSASSPNTATAQLQGSIDGINYFSVGSPVSVTGNSVLSIAAADVYYRYYRLSYAIASGSYVSTVTILVYGDRA